MQYLNPETECEVRNWMGGMVSGLALKLDHKHRGEREEVLKGK